MNSTTTIMNSTINSTMSTFFTTKAYVEASSHSYSFTGIIIGASILVSVCIVGAIIQARCESVSGIFEVINFFK